MADEAVPHSAMAGEAVPHSAMAGEAVSHSVMAGEGPPSTPSPAMMGLHVGTDEAPETSATLIVQVASLTVGHRYVLDGPGLREPAVLAVDGLPADFAAVWQRNHALFPCGIDLILCAGNQLAALPRSVSVRGG
jgi:alpha-D-ribose 1-methylphosphonate 5-triphosphate synthase subunit PhnH